MPQTTDEVEVVVLLNNGEFSIGKYRQTLLEDARGDYVCFVDDDDGLPDDYCQTILDNLGKDYVGFKVKLSNNDIEQPPAIHSLRYPGWFQDAQGYYRGVTHLNPIKRELALKGNFMFSPGAGEDEGWARQVRPFVKTENYIDRFMYFYRHVNTDTHFGSGKQTGNDKPKKLRYKHLRYTEIV